MMATVKPVRNLLLRTVLHARENVSRILIGECLYV
jgi:hypothetical protein